MNEKMMNEHLNIERISALLDEPWADLKAEAHLEGCDLCRAEYERLSRMRMALSGLGELESPAGSWERLTARLDEALGPEPVPIQPTWRRAVEHWPIQVAAALALFAGGVVSGLQFTGGDGTDSTPIAARGEDLPIVLPTGDEGTDPSYANVLDQLARLESPLRQARIERADGTLDPKAAAEVMVRLDALIAASRQAVARAPGDELANAILFELVEQRNGLTNRLEQRAHLMHAADW